MYSGVKNEPSGCGANAHFSHSRVAGGVCGEIDAIPTFVSTRLIPAALCPAFDHVCMACSTSPCRPPAGLGAGAGGGAGGGAEVAGAGGGVGAADGGGETAGAGGAEGGGPPGGAFPGGGRGGLEGDIVVKAGPVRPETVPGVPLPPAEASKKFAASCAVLKVKVTVIVCILAPSDLRGLTC